MILFAVACHAKALAKAVSGSQDNHVVFTLAHIRDRNRLKGWRLQQRPTSNAQRPFQKSGKLRALMQALSPEVVVAVAPKN